MKERDRDREKKEIWYAERDINSKRGKESEIHSKREREIIFFLNCGILLDILITVLLGICRPWHKKRVQKWWLKKRKQNEDREIILNVLGHYTKMYES